MTGPAPGKIRIPGVKAILMAPGFREEVRPEAYIHLKGYSRARVTHLDLEDPVLNEKLLPPGRSMYARIRGVIGGFRLDFSRYVDGLVLEVSSEALREILRPGEASIAYVGGKPGGIFIGFKKPFIQRLEEAARRIMGNAS